MYLNFRVLFEAVPGLYLVVTADDAYRVVAVSDAYLAATYQRREDTLGRGLFELFPADPADAQSDGVRNLRASLERVRRLGRTDAMGLQRYPIPRPTAMGGGFEERYWSPLNAPVLGDDGRVRHIIHRVEDVTAFVRLEQQASRRESAWQRAEARLQHMRADVVLRAQELQRLNDRLRMAQRMAQLGSWELQLPAGALTLSEHMCRLLGVRADAAPATLEAFAAHVHAQDREREALARQQSLQRQEAVEVEYRIVQADATVRHVFSCVEPVLDEQGRALLLAATVQDVTERKSAEQRLQMHVARLELLHGVTRAIGERMDVPGIFRVLVMRLEQDLELDFCAVAVCDGETAQATLSHVGLAGEARARRMGWTVGMELPVAADGLLRAVQGELVYEPDTARLSFELPRRMAEAGLRSLVLAPLRVDGHTHGLLLAACRRANAFASTDTEFLFQLGEHGGLAMRQAQMHGALKDAFNKLRRSQHAALQHERLRALGEMASGIAHDINNALSPVTLYTESLLEQESGLSSAGRAKLETMQMALDDVSRTVSRMREFYRRDDDSEDRVPVSMNLLVRQVVELTQPRWRDLALREGAAIEVGLELQPDLPTIAVSEAEWREALVNLVFNAVDAMPQGGALTLRTHRVIAPDTGDAVELTVGDTGAGMDEDTRSRCIEPFFTTKGRRGTGLGLAMVYGTVQRHGGTLRIDSHLGQGTQVTLTIPASPGRGQPRARPVVDAAALPPLSLLLVDDDATVLRTLQDALRVDGHEVRGCSGGREALEQLQAARAQERRFDAVITDLGMPHVDGKAVAAAAKAQDPACWVVMATGWGHRMGDEERLIPGVDRLIAKPLRMEALRAALSAGIAARPQATTTVKDSP